MKERKTPQTSVNDRRTAPRQASSGRVAVHLLAQDLQGDGDNVSRSGILFYTQGDVEVEVEFEQDGVLQRRIGHLVRCERIRGNRGGWAVEFARR
jgi:hypothetical protein